MRVVYRTSIIDEIIEVKYQADLNNKEISYIVLTKSEWRRLQSETDRFLTNTDKGKMGNMFCGIPIKVE